MEGTIGEIRMFAGNFAPRAWAFCEGQLLSINSNQALFSIIGTIYGGDGRSTFALPDLRGRTAIGPGNGPGLSSRREGQKIGSEYNTLTTPQLPSHTHAASSTVAITGNIDKDTFNAEIDAHGVNDAGSSASPLGKMLGKTGLADKEYADPSANEVVMAKGAVKLANDVPFTGTGAGTVTVGNTGANQSINNMQPSLAVYYIICLQGVFPSRS